MNKSKNFKNKGAIWAILAIGIPVVIVGWLGIKYFFGGQISAAFLGIIDYLTLVVLSAINFLFGLFASLAAAIIDVFIVLNPFDYGGVAVFLWEFFKNISYVILVFLALYSGINWILNREDQARRILFGVIVIAFLINFTFLLAKELFMAVSFIQINLLKSANLNRGGTNASKLGSLIYAAFNTLPPGALADQLKALNIEVVENISTSTEAQKPEALRIALNITANLAGIFLAIIYSLTLWAFAGIAVARYFIISFLTGLLPLAVIAYITPGYEKHWRSWWQWFLNWTFNILILIVLILVGIALIATTTSGNLVGAFNEGKIQELLTPSLEERVALGQETGSNLSLFFAIASKYAFLVIYFFMVMKLTLQLGGQFAEYGYSLATRGWMAIGGAAAAVGTWAAAPGLAKIGSRLSEVGGGLLKSRFGLVRRLGLGIKGIGESLEKPSKEQMKKEAESVWSSLMEGKSPEEIAGVFKNYRGAFREELAKIIGKNLGAEDIAKLAGSLDLQKESTGTIKALCKKLNCALMRLKERKYSEALSPLADALDHRKIKLSDLEKLFTQAGVGDTNQINQLLGNYFGFLEHRDIRDLLAHPDNLGYLKRLREGGVPLPISEEEQKRTASQSPAFRAVEEVGEVFAKNLGIEPKPLIQELQRRYLEGEITAKTLEDWRGEIMEGKVPQKLKEVAQNAIEAARSNIEQQKNNLQARVSQIDGEIKRLEEEKSRIGPAVEGGITYLDRVNKINELEKQIEKLQQEKNSINSQISALDAQLQQLPQIPQQISNPQEIIGLINKAAGIFKNPYGGRFERRRERKFEERLRALEEQRERGGGGASSEQKTESS